VFHGKVYVAEQEADVMRVIPEDDGRSPEAGNLNLKSRRTNRRKKRKIYKHNLRIMYNEN
jgi:hypothetical protein